MFNDLRYVQGDQDVQVPAHLNFGKYILDKLHRKDEEVAVENGQTGEKLTYKELTQFAVDLSVSFSKIGLRKGEVVALGCEKRIEFIPIALATIFSGATFTAYELKCGKAVLKHKLDLVKPKYFVCTDLFWEAYSNILTETKSIKCVISLDHANAKEKVIPIKTLIKINHDAKLFEPVKVEGQTDVAIVLYSSGTTGMPKGVKLTHLNCILNSLPDDFKDESLKTAFLAGEFYHNYDTFMSYKFLSAGRRLVYITDITPENFMDCLEKCQVNIALIIPSIVNWISKIDEDVDINLDSLKVIYSRSSPLHMKIMERVKQRFPAVKYILQGYGMTEAGELTSENWGAKGPKLGSVGCASPGITLKVVDPKSRAILGPNSRGEICLRGPVQMKGYIGVDPSTYLDEDRFFKTGDLGYYDEDGYFYIVDRLKEIISYDGNKIAPLELETILQLHPDVKEAGVVGKPVEVYGEEPTAFVVRRPGSNVTEEELTEYVSKEVSPYMQLRGGVRFISHLPRNTRGKVLRRKLREMLHETFEIV